MLSKMHHQLLDAYKEAAQAYTDAVAKTVARAKVDASNAVIEFQIQNREVTRELKAHPPSKMA